MNEKFVTMPLIGFWWVKVNVLDVNVIRTLIYFPKRCLFHIFTINDDIRNRKNF